MVKRKARARGSATSAGGLYSKSAPERHICTSSASAASGTSAMSFTKAIASSWCRSKPCLSNTCPSTANSGRLQALTSALLSCRASGRV